MCYHGKGFTDAGIWEMPLDFFLWSVSRLNKQLSDEANERQKAMQSARRT